MVWYKEYGTPEVRPMLEPRAGVYLSTGCDKVYLKGLRKFEPLLKGKRFLFLNGRCFSHSKFSFWFLCLYSSHTKGKWGRQTHTHIHTHSHTCSKNNHGRECDGFYQSPCGIRGQDGPAATTGSSAFGCLQWLSQPFPRVPFISPP